MLFSAGVESYRCAECDEEFANVIPTSIIPMAATCVVAGSAWSALFRRYFGEHWAFHVVGFVIAFGTLWLLYEALERLTNRSLRAGRCPRCGAELERVSTGFHDGCLPNPWEVLLYALTVGLGFSAWGLSSLLL